MKCLMQTLLFNLTIKTPFKNLLSAWQQKFKGSVLQTLLNNAEAAVAPLKSAWPPEWVIALEQLLKANSVGFS